MSLPLFVFIVIVVLILVYIAIRRLATAAKLGSDEVLLLEVVVTILAIVAILDRAGLLHL